MLAALVGVGCEAVIGADFDVQKVECTSAKPPERPAATAVNDDVRAIYGVLTTVDFGDVDRPDGTPTYKDIGFDLDGVCALRGARPSCTPFWWATPDVSNDVHGRDNQSGALIRDQKAAFSYFAFNSETINQGIRQGIRAPLAFVRLTQYNGRIDDDEVALDWYVTMPFHTGKVVDDAGAPRPNAENERWPLWTGTVDGPWIESPTGKDEPKYPVDAYQPSKFRDPKAYVRDFQVVARLPKRTPLQLASVPFYSDDLFVVIKLRPGNVSDPTVYVDHGVIAGHVAATELFKKWPRMADTFGFARLCKNDDQYQRVKRYLCAHLDSHADGRYAPDAPCDAISVGVKFFGAPGLLGAAFEQKDVSICEGENDPATDTCTIPAN